MRECPSCHTPHPDNVEVCPVDGVQLRTQTRPLTAPDVSPAGSVDLDLAGSRGTGVTTPGKQSALHAAPQRRSERAEDLIGRTLGSYKLLSVIGYGGMGRVYRAEHVELGRKVALKLLKPEYAVKQAAIARFFQEARAVNKIRHRNIVDVTDLVKLDDGSAFIIMELLEGMTLGKAHRTAGPLEPSRILHIAAQVCDGLSAAHQQEVVHRDLKPDNVFLCPDGAGGDLVKLLDFGVAKLLGTEGKAEEMAWKTAAGSVVGTPAYMSPEQAGGMPVDGRSDLYSLGAILYELFCGRPPFEGRSFGDFVNKHLNATPIPPSQTETGKNLSPQIEAMILRCLAKNPNERAPSAAALRKEILDLLSVWETGEASVTDVLFVPSTGDRSGAVPLTSPAPGPHTLTPAPQPSPVPGSYPGTSQHPFGHTPSAPVQLVSGSYVGAAPPRPSRWPWIAFTAGLLALAGVAFLLASRGGPEARPAPPVTEAAPVQAQPAPAPVVVPMDPGKVKLEKGKVTVAFRSRPSGADVFAAGRDDPACTTPCDVVVDPDDGGSPTRRSYVLLREGYEPQRVTVPLDDTSAQEVRVVLQRTRRRASPATEPASEPPTEPADPEPPLETDPPREIDPADTLNPFGKNG